MHVKREIEDLTYGTSVKLYSRPLPIKAFVFKGQSIGATSDKYPFSLHPCTKVCN